MSPDPIPDELVERALVAYLGHAPIGWALHPRMRALIEAIRPDLLREKEEEIEERPPDAAVNAEAERVQAQIMATFAARKAAREAAGIVTTPSRAHRGAQLT